MVQIGFGQISPSARLSARSGNEISPRIICYRETMASVAWRSRESEKQARERREVKWRGEQKGRPLITQPFRNPESETCS